jgi:hypothetical protein
MINIYSIDKTAFSIAQITDPSDMKEFWRSCTYIERLQMVEYFRQLNYADYKPTQRLQRVFEIIQPTSR